MQVSKRKITVKELKEALNKFNDNQIVIFDYDASDVGYIDLSIVEDLKER